MLAARAVIVAAHAASAAAEHAVSAAVVVVVVASTVVAEAASMVEAAATAVADAVKFRLIARNKKPVLLRQAGFLREDRERGNKGTRKRESTERKERDGDDSLSR
jgi:hypothetical protein